MSTPAPNIESVKFRNDDMAWHMAALILFPPNFDTNKKYPTIISVHPFGSCKEQTSSAVYGKALAEQGFVVIAFDASYQGDSGGAPRWVESPSQRVADVSHAIDYAVTLPYVDAERIGAIGICGGGGYVLNAALTEKRIKAVVGITPVNIGRLFREGFSQYDPLGALAAMAGQRTQEALGGEVLVNELLPASPEAAQQAGFTDIDPVEATDYYKTPRGQQPNGWTRMVFSHAQQTLAWDAFNFAETLMTQPMMAVIGGKPGAFGAYRDGNEIYGRSTASKDRRLITVEGWSHYDLYDRPEPVALAMAQVIPFFEKNL